MKLSREKGFTLIELMIVVAIVGVLAAIAIPSYRDFTIRARLSEVIGSMSACKLSAVDFYLTNSGWNQENTNIPVSNFGLCDNAQGSRQVAPNGITISAVGVISAVTQDMGSGVADGTVLTMRPVLQGANITTWVCGDAADGTTFLPRYRPGSCQG
ncbi:MAG: pilin [Lysobacterales bacterium]